MALLDCLVALGGNQAVGYLVTGKPPGRYGNEHQSLVPYQVFPTADGHVIVAVGNDTQWQRYCEAIERADLAANERWAKVTGRVVGRAELIPDFARTMLDAHHGRVGGAARGSTTCRAGRSTTTARCSPTRTCATAACASI